jgi:hypothetical protein
MQSPHYAMTEHRDFLLGDSNVDDNAIDTHMLPPFRSSTDNWCLFLNTYPDYYNTMYRKPVVPSTPPPSPKHVGYHVLASRNDEKMAEVCTFAPQALDLRSSVSSESSPPGMTEDSMGSSDDSDGSVDIDRYDVSTTKLWNTYYEGISEKQPPSLNPQRRPLPSFTARERATTFSNEVPRPSSAQRHYASEHLHALKPQHSSVDLQNSHVQRATNAGVVSRKALPPMPPVPTLATRSQSVSTASGETSKQWAARGPPAPLSLFPTCRQPAQSGYTMSRPSTAPARRCSPVSPTFPPHTATVEKSFFDDDDEPKSSFTTKLHRRGASAGTKKDVLPNQPKRRSFTRSASDVIKGVFGLGPKKKEI